MRASLSPSLRSFALAFSLLLLLLTITYSTAYAQGEGPSPYREFPVIGSRVAVWIAAQVHLMFAAFMLGVPMFALVVEFVGYRTGQKRYDELAREFTKLVLVAASITAAFGALLTFLLFTLYPAYMAVLTGVFQPTFAIYPLFILFEVSLLYLYWYTWDRLDTAKGKRWHLLIGLALNITGTLMMFIANAWLTFSITPESGGEALFDAAGSYTGTIWQAMNNATWWPINIHRVIANVAFGGAIVGLYAAIRFLNASSEEERAHYDWMGYVGSFIAVIGLIPLPFAGYWLGREIYGFSQQMGVTMMGGFLSWLWILQAMLIAVLFLSINYYLWIGMGRIEGGERYSRHIKWLLLVLTLGVLVWATPHNPVVTAEEQTRIGGAFHPLLGVLGVMSAKNTAVNLMILTTFLSFLFYRRAGKGNPVQFREHGNSAVAVLVIVLIISIVLALSPASYILRRDGSNLLPAVIQMLHVLALIGGVGLTLADRGKAGQWIILGAAASLVIFFGIYGYFVEATVRIGFSVYQVLAVLTALIMSTTIDVYLFQGAPNIGTIKWGSMPARAQYVLILLAVTFTWLMGLMGYARNAIRQHWHIYEVLQDMSVDAFSPTLGFAARVISVCVLVFLGLIGFIFWLGHLGEKKPVASAAPLTPRTLPASD